MRLSPVFLAPTILNGLSVASPLQKRACPPFSGNFTIQQYQLYPENVDFDFNTCKLFIGQLWNASLGIYDPYTKKHETIEFAGISHNPLFHLGAVGVDRKSGLLSFIADYSMSFATNGADIAGTNWLMQMDLSTREVLYKINLTAVADGKYGGFQDVEQDPDGNVFIVGTWPGTLLKAKKGAKTEADVTPWYLPQHIVQTEKGIGGIATLGWMLLAQGDKSNQIWRFDMRAEKGTPVPVKITKGNHTFDQSDAIYLPPKYEGKVLLVAEDTVGISVFYSKDAAWVEAEYRGLVPIGDVPAGASIVTAAQVGDAVYKVVEPFGDEGLGGPGTAGNRTDFMFQDITAVVDALLK
ncbi:hypothetical protein EJ04DRAFT_605806 [Polyplosphaeria fusca]|uniref:Uncharacterized protein n=1 Tax=Polyplosphaeria fusca TaxID=682080 RepID=A0A9P4QXI2_9PLEO|nr:hypothetical protein EJ04DRAFT_605806 [Polyplosphaeria fusca]